MEIELDEGRVYGHDTIPSNLHLSLRVYGWLICLRGMIW
jgi:hypothetical protein